MSISASDVKQLRDRTGAGMMDCKKALKESGGDLDAAIEYLRKKGQKVAEKRADREANQGIIVTKVTDDGKKAVALELNCETDFVAKNEEFGDHAASFAQTVLDEEITDRDTLYAAQANGTAISEHLKDLVGKIGEKIDIGQFELVKTDGAIVSYVHPGNQLAVLVEFAGPLEDKEVGKDIAMQIAAMNPIAVDRDSVPQERIDEELQIAKEQMINEGKPAEIAEKAAEGKVRKFYEEHVLLEQKFVKDGSITVQEFLKQQNAPTVSSYKRLQLGESGN